MPNPNGIVTLALSRPSGHDLHGDVARTLRRGRELAEAGLVPAERAGEIDAVAARYSVAIPPALAALIDPDDANDPIARQFVPDAAELDAADDEIDDPIGDGAHSPVKGLVHRYPDRVLLMPTLSCPVYCRYCFRRDRVGRAAGMPSPAEIDAALGYISAHEEVREVILTGGDPLSLSDSKLGALLGRIAAIPHVLNIRIHTRVPVAQPERIREGLIAALQVAKPVWMAIHCNHPRELTDAVAAACDRLMRGGVALLSQSVLLRGVNDDVETLTALMRRLVELRVKPYYLHHPDRAKGTARFRLSLSEGRALVDALRGNVSGLCQPTYVVDIPGGHGKVPVQKARIAPGSDPDGNGPDWTLTDHAGRTHGYRDSGPR